MEESRPRELVDASVSTEDLEGTAEETQETVSEGPPFAEASRGPEPVGAIKAGTPPKNEPPSGPTAALQECRTAMLPPASPSVRGTVRVLSPGDGNLRYPSPTLPPVAKQLKRSASTPLSSQSSSAVSSTQAERTPSVSSTSSESTENLTSSSSNATSSSSSSSSGTSSGSSSSSYITLQDGSIPWDPSRYPVRASQPSSVESPTFLESAGGSASSAGQRTRFPSPLTFRQAIGQPSEVCKPIPRYADITESPFASPPMHPDVSRAADSTSSLPSTSHSAAGETSSSTAPSTSGTPYAIASAVDQMARPKIAEGASSPQHSAAREDPEPRKLVDRTYVQGPEPSDVEGGDSAGVGQDTPTDSPSCETKQDSEEAIDSDER